MKIVAVEQEIIKARGVFDALVEHFTDASNEDTRADQAEREIFAGLMQVGQHLLSAFLKRAGDGNQGRQRKHRGKLLRRSEQKKTRPYRSIFGVITIQRYVYARRAKQKAEYLPLDEKLGLPAGEHSYVLEDWLQRLCVNDAFAASVQCLADLLGCTVSTRAAERINRELAKYVEPFRTQQPMEQADEQIIVVSADGKGVPMRRPLDERLDQSHVPAWIKSYRKLQAKRPQDKTDKRVTGGQNRMQKQMAYVGAVYSIAPFKRTADDVIDELRRKKKASGRPRPKNKRVWAEMTDYHKQKHLHGQPRIFAGLAWEVYHRDPDHKHPIVCLMDGQHSLWTMKDQWLRGATGILDIFHVMERLWQAAYCFHKAGSRQAEDFVTHYLQMLLEGKVSYAIGVFQRQLRALTPSKRKSLSKVIQYFRNNRRYMQYHDYLAKGYPIGSGVVEGTCRHLVRDRMERTGMRWELDGAQAMLQTRSAYVNGQWDSLIEYKIQNEQATTYGQAA